MLAAQGQATAEEKCRCEKDRARFCGILLLRKQTNVGETPASARHLSVETHMNHKEMQRHYAAMIIRERMKQARITGMM